MAYPIIKSVFDNFTTAYQNAREARAREERLKENSMREFDQNQRLWNQDYRIGDQYANYISPANQYALQDLGRANELGIAGQAGNVAIAKMNSGAKTQFATPENTALISQRFNNNLVRSVDESDFYNRFTPQQKNDYVMAGGLQRVNSGQQARYVVNQFDSPEQAAIRRNNAEMQHLSSSNSLESLKNEIDGHSSPAIQNSGIMDSESSSLLNRYPQPTFSKATTTPVAQTPMQGMVNSNNSELNKLIIARDAVVSEMTPMIRSGIGMENSNYKALNLKLAAINDAILQSRANQIPR